MQSQQNQIQQLEKQLSYSKLQLDSHSRRLLSLTATTTDDWRVAEVEYLLRLANQRLMISSDVSTALDLVVAADKILLELADPRLVALRRSLAEDKAALGRVASLDIEGMFLTLAALAGSVDQLPVISVPAFQPNRAETTNEDQGALASSEFSADAATSDDQAAADVDSKSMLQSALDGMSGILRKGWVEIRSWLVINRKDLDIKPLLPPEQQYYLRGNLQLLLNQAQVALLDKQEEPYRSSLGTAIDWLNAHFPANEPAISNVVAELENLAAQDISPALPDLSASLLAVKAFMNERFNQPAVREQPASTATGETDVAGEDA